MHLAILTASNGTARDASGYWVVVKFACRLAVESSPTAVTALTALFEGNIELSIYSMRVNP